MRILKYFLLIVCVFLISATAKKCNDDKGQICHQKDPDYPRYCDQIAHTGIIPIVLSPSELSILVNSNIIIEIIGPSWIKYDRIGDSMQIVFAAIDKYESISTEIITGKLERNIVGEKIQLNLNLIYLQKEFINKFLENLKEDSKIYIYFGMNLGTMMLYSKEEYVYEPFAVNVNLYANGSLYASWQLEYSIACLMTSYLRSTLKEVPDYAFSGNPDTIRNAILNKLDALENMINAKNPQGAYQKLKNDIMSKFDGQNGGNPQDDWIVDPYYASATYSFYKKILNLLDYLRS